ncbi:MAG: 16S rRNA (guanine(966)-N(2))-methyltransferase RsmD [Gammaproteobacteria bacterium]|nr:16S rRNA (guanine(966)-N(2))-methyltransferase RsmD [Gammaproteobacteria bacterium]
MKAKSHQQNTLRIIGGYWRGRKLRFPDVEGLRPTPDRVRETLFNWLQGLTLEEDCLDLYAGSGACGLEALSRGARHVSFVDASGLATAAIKSHLTALQCTQADVLTCSAQHFLKTAQTQRRFGLVFMDPPFAAGLLATDCLALERSGLLKPGAHIYLESGDPLPEAMAEPLENSMEETFPSNWVLQKKGRAGAVYFGLYHRGLSHRQEIDQ